MCDLQTSGSRAMSHGGGVAPMAELDCSQASNLTIMGSSSAMATTPAQCGEACFEATQKASSMANMGSSIATATTPARCDEASSARLACLEAQKACSPVWIDDARSRIRQAALAVLETQQQSQHLASIVDDHMLLDDPEPRWTEHEWSMGNADYTMPAFYEEDIDDEDSLTLEPLKGQVIRPSESLRGAIVNFVKSSIHLIMYFPPPSLTLPLTAAHASSFLPPHRRSRLSPPSLTFPLLSPTIPPAVAHASPPWPTLPPTVAHASPHRRLRFPPPSPTLPPTVATLPPTVAHASPHCRPRFPPPSPTLLPTVAHATVAHRHCRPRLPSHRPRLAFPPTSLLSSLSPRRHHSPAHHVPPLHHRFSTHAAHPLIPSHRVGCGRVPRGQQHPSVAYTFISPSLISPFLISPSLISPFLISPSLISPSLISSSLTSPSLSSPALSSLALSSPSHTSPSLISSSLISPSLISPIRLTPFRPIPFRPTPFCPTPFHPTPFCPTPFRPTPFCPTPFRHAILLLIPFSSFPRPSFPDPIIPSANFHHYTIRFVLHHLRYPSLSIPIPSSPSILSPTPPPIPPLAIPPLPNPSFSHSLLSPPRSSMSVLHLVVHVLAV
ncbi:unnamed protein product [Closterium sp. NIES-64]|nr:unnamed protein product [Closterium sp. NIES-64]